MPRCYLLAVCSGSSLDQHSNNVTLFNLVEQLNVPPNAPPPPNNALPLEIHAYFEIAPEEVNEGIEVRFAMVSDAGLETYTDPFTYKSPSPRFRTRTLGLPFPPALGSYRLRVDHRRAETGAWKRDDIGWPILIVEHAPKPTVVH
jgi:hypothetical protein